VVLYKGGVKVYEAYEIKKRWGGNTLSFTSPEFFFKKNLS